ncbi:S9 family peptidase [Granulicella mallensis]|uniref:Peptidase S9 prolyl oligopeptidase n=1 Tax=Granulicella mallensis (strain ATCC BAA-1857 / DSM 23137 / MP5ACTX8) TaxID=682795 RepID=G8NPN8_GRAMM|nr:S9 family peptidase [Granulicella mallensis]AEU36050.1 peptidase S9 prolyl oligopeptidase [Granulicella mallensis MP5ACTX8]
MERVYKFIAAAFVISLLPIANAQESHIPTVDELLNLRYVGSPALSPDGQYVAYEIEHPDWQSDNYAQELVVENLKTGKRAPVPSLEGVPGSPEWSPDGRWLAFVEHPKQGVGQIWIVPAEGSVAWQVSKSATDVGLFHWSADSKHIAFLTTQRDHAVNGRAERFGSFEVVGKDYQQTQLWSVDLEAASGHIAAQVPRVLVSSPAFSIADFSWSPDSTMIAFTAAGTPLLTAYSSQDIYLLDRTKGNEVRKIVGLPSPDFSPIFSPDGKKIAFLTWLGQRDFFYSNVHIVTVDVEDAWQRPVTAAAAVRDVTARFDENPSLLGWSGNSLYFSAEQKTSTHLFRIDSDGNHLTRITSGDNFVLDSASFSHNFTAVALVAEDAFHMPELYVSDLAPLALRQVTHFTDQVRGWRLGTPTIVTWKSADGTPIEGVLYSPPTVDPNQMYPLIVDLHGGPADVSRAILSPAEPIYATQVFVAQGAFVLQPNYRDSSGYGAAFRSSSLENIGASESADVLSGVEDLLAKGHIDPKRIAVVGSSWGGYLTAFLATHTSRFIAASESSGITDLTTDYSVTDNPALFRQFFHGTPWVKGDIYRKNSPISTVTDARTPMLLQEGRDDRRVPPANAFELYRSLQDVGVDSRLIVYSGFGHGFNNPKEMRAAIQTNLDWFNHYLWKKEIPQDSPIWGSSEITH